MNEATRTLLAGCGGRGIGAGGGRHAASFAGADRLALSELLLEPSPEVALRQARDSGDLARILPAFVPSVGYDQRSRFHAATLDEHVFSVVEGVAHDTPAFELRLAALLHDIGKPAAAFRGDDGRVHYGGWASAGVPSHEVLGSWIAQDVMEQLGFGDALTRRVVELVRWHMPRERERVDAERLARRLGPLGRDLCVLRRSDAWSKTQAAAQAGSGAAGGDDGRLVLFERSVAVAGR